MLHRLSHLLAISAVFASSASAQRADLTVLTAFLADQSLTPRHDAPITWLDAASYLVFDKGDVDPEARGFHRVDARSGARSPLYPPGSDVAALSALPGVRRDALLEVLGREDAYVWNAAHSAFVVELADDLLAFDIETDVARRLTSSPGAETGAQFSPDGRLVAFVHDHDLHVVDVAGGPVRALTSGGDADFFYGKLDWVYQEEIFGRGNFQGFWWSPDSTRIALFEFDESPVREFTIVGDTPVYPVVETTKYPKAGEPNPLVRLGVVDAIGGEVRWFDVTQHAAADRLIVGVTWHPSGDEVFFQVTDRQQTWLEMLAGDAATGEVRTVFREDSDCWVDPGAEPVWIGDGANFLWQSERDGREHVYRYSRGGELLGRVTEGAFDVEEIHAVDAERNLMWFGSDRGDSKQFHLWRIGLDGANAQRLTQREGWHEIELSPDRAMFVDRFSAFTHRLSWSVHAADGALVRSIVESDMAQLDPFAMAKPEFHQIANRDGFSMEAILIKPRDYEVGRRYPVVCHVYSGPHAPRVRNRWRARDYLWHQLLAQRGYLVWICDNRSASGKGRESAKVCWRDLGSSELRDQEDGVKWLVDNGYADAERVGVWGWSYGGYQTLFNLTHSKVWKLGIAVNPVTDWKLYDSIYTERYMGLPQDNPAGYARASILEAAGALRGELLLVHATMDDNVHLQNSHALIHALQQFGKPFRYMAYPRVRHGIEDQRQQLHLFTLMADFITEKL